MRPKIGHPKGDVQAIGHECFDLLFLEERTPGLKCDLASAMYKRAIGYEVIEEDQLVEERDGKTKKKVHRIKKQVGPDYKALVYLLTKHFGKEYGESYEELLLNERKFAAKEVTWTNADEVVEEEEYEEVEDSFL